MATDMRALRRAISDPGATTPRGDNFNEHIVDWQLRAILAQPEALIAALIATGALVEEWGSVSPTDIGRIVKMRDESAARYVAKRLGSPIFRRVVESQWREVSS